MRAARLLRMLLLLQNRGRMTSATLAGALEVTARTILRDVDALTEAGFPILVHRGNQGGIELGFNYRTRLTGLSLDEAEALAVVLACPVPDVAALGMADAAARARAKLLESLPDAVRHAVERAGRRFRFDPPAPSSPDPSIAALAEAVRNARRVCAREVDGTLADVHPAALAFGEGGWRIIDARDGVAPVLLTALDHLQIGGPGSASKADWGPAAGGRNRPHRALPSRVQEC